MRSRGGGNGRAEGVRVGEEDKGSDARRAIISAIRFKRAQLLFLRGESYHPCFAVSPKVHK
jgi:hypothetical protein